MPVTAKCFEYILESCFTAENLLDPVLDSGPLLPEEIKEQKPLDYIMEHMLLWKDELRDNLFQAEAFQGVAKQIKVGKTHKENGEFAKWLEANGPVPEKEEEEEEEGSDDEEASPKKKAKK